ncbi:uncharacterized protein Z520_11035 [Fonsecaea multimorphosa CBS 102226]|uniref:Uncharacterized protein n=1 Tax=Fonsecaea multimorphosa CBS 102226 TaxID=1442371 RepID=A0A0D2I7J6_9EURO|nr:uncharacterized protein Z520_11035 [Fonsecaea multimorphosa CBS 102226]KIX93181.1 hypothetical protein Z520_11035 [Fonsecaea multimorphosa CBS 102226]
MKSEPFVKAEDDDHEEDTTTRKTVLSCLLDWITDGPAALLELLAHESTLPSRSVARPAFPIPHGALQDAHLYSNRCPLVSTSRDADNASNCCLFIFWPGVDRSKRENLLASRVHLTPPEIFNALTCCLFISGPEVDKSRVRLSWRLEYILLRRRVSTLRLVASLYRGRGPTFQSVGLCLASRVYLTPPARLIASICCLFICPGPVWTIQVSGSPGVSSTSYSAGESQHFESLPLYMARPEVDSSGLASSIPYCATIQYNHQGMPQGMPQPMYGAPQPQTSAYGFSTMTPPSYGNMSHMLPAGIFFPTLTHIDHEQQVHHGGFAGPANARRRASTP